jgi:hypothetical protein
MMKTTGALIGLGAVLLAGCSSGSGSGSADQSDAAVCARALDAADHGFTALSVQIRQVQGALRSAFAGNVGAANQQLAAVQTVSPSEYKRLEAQCRQAVRP